MSSPSSSRTASLTDEETVTVTVPAPDASGITAISSRLLDATDFLAGVETPVAAAEVSFAGQNIFATTAADGSFTLTATEAGTQTLQLVPASGTTAPDGSPYAEGRESVALISGVTTVPEDPFLLLRLPAGACEPVIAGQPTQVVPRRPRRHPGPGGRCRRRRIRGLHRRGAHRDRPEHPAAPHQPLPAADRPGLQPGVRALGCHDLPQSG